MDPVQTAPTGAVWSGSTLFVYEDPDQTSPIGAVWSGSHCLSMRLQIC